MMLPFPKPLFLHPKPRLPYRSGMTIAVGFTTSDAVVLCADSQETVSEYSKSTTQKIRMVTSYGGPSGKPQWRIAIVGSSDAAQYIELFEHEVEKRLAQAGNDFNYVRSVDIIRATLHQIHKQHIWPRRTDKPQLQFLIALQGIEPFHSRELLVGNDSALYPVRLDEHYASIGIGFHMAKAIKDLILPNAGMIYNSPTEVIANYGIYLLWHVKKSIVGCDGNTLVLILQNGNYRWVTQEEIAEIEQAIQMLYPSQRQLLSALFNPSVDMRGVSNLGNSFVGAVTAIKGQLERGKIIRQQIEDAFKHQREAQRAAAAAQEQAPKKVRRTKRSVARKSKRAR